MGQLVLTSAVYACTAAAPLHALGAISLLGGLAFGGLWALMVALTSELFGVAHFAGNYSLMHLAPNAGSFFLATELSGILYERAKASHPGQTAICIGYDCFRCIPDPSKPAAYDETRRSSPPAVVDLGCPSQWQWESAAS